MSSADHLFCARPAPVPDGTHPVGARRQCLGAALSGLFLLWHGGHSRAAQMPGADPRGRSLAAHHVRPQAGQGRALRPLRIFMGSALLGMDRLPLLVAQRLGFFRQAGLHVTLLTDTEAQDRPPGPDDVQCLAFEQVLSRRAKGVPVRAFAQLARTPQWVLLLDARLAPRRPLPVPADGWRVGIPGFGGEGLSLVQQARQRAVLGAVRPVALASGAAAFDALQRQQVDAIVCGEPQASLLEAGRSAVALADTRLPDDSWRWYGGPMPGVCLAAGDAFIERHAHTVQALTDATVQGLRWMLTASMGDWAQLLPEVRLPGWRGLYLQALRQVSSSFSGDARLSAQASATALRVVRQQAPEISRDLLSSSYTNAFAARVPVREGVSTAGFGLG